MQIRDLIDGQFDTNAFLFSVCLFVQLDRLDTISASTCTRMHPSHTHAYTCLDPSSAFITYYTNVPQARKGW